MPPPPVPASRRESAPPAGHGQTTSVTDVCHTHTNRDLPGAAAAPTVAPLTADNIAQAIGESPAAEPGSRSNLGISDAGDPDEGLDEHAVVTKH